MKRTLGMAVLLTVLLSATPDALVRRSAAAPRPPASSPTRPTPESASRTPDVAEGSTPQQACQAILSCLNNVDCLKTYCSATTIRTGWKLESAK